MRVCWCLCVNFIVALKDVSVTIPQAVKRGSNAMLTCNYDMENDTLYSVKWYKGRREFYRYTPKENPAMKVFLTQSGLNVERNLSNQSHVVLLAVPLNISGKFTCEISVEAPSFQTAMVSGEMEVVELPEEQASVTGIQPRYRIGDLVDGNCSIKYSKPAANLTWTINGIVVPPHHIKTYQIEKYEQTNLESVMSAIHFMVTTQHFIKGQMRLKCTASIFDIFREEIESVIEEDRPRIMASGRSYDAHSYPHDDNSVGYEDHNESYLTYFSAPKSSASPRAKAPFYIIFQYFHKLLPALSLKNMKNHICNTLATFIIDIERYYGKITHNDMTTYWLKTEQQQQLIKLITVMAILLKIYQQCNSNSKNNNNSCCWWQMVGMGILWHGINILTKKFCTFKKHLAQQKQQQMMMKSTTIMNEYEDMHHEKQQLESLLVQAAETNKEYSYLCEQKRVVTATIDVLLALRIDCQFENEQCLAANQNVINEKVFWHTTATGGPAAALEEEEEESFSNVDYQQQMSQTLDNVPSTNATTSLAFSLHRLPFAATTTTIGIVVGAATGVTFARDSFPLCDDAFVATESNNANYMSRDQTLLMMTSSKSTTTYPNRRRILQQRAAAATIKLAMQWKRGKEASSSAPTSPSPLELTVTLAKQKTVAHKGNIKASLSPSSSFYSPFALNSRYFEAFSTLFSQKNNSHLMAIIGKFLLHQC
ncbi:beaten path Ic isoform X2 [Musca autumnalis]|uniref:beaten path Ic isoform X2 n=1 Tax=Musca autumnalis TaxID=221902 RepID=UPI003CE6AF00